MSEALPYTPAEVVMTPVELYRFEKARHVDVVTPKLMEARAELLAYLTKGSIRHNGGRVKPVMILPPSKYEKPPARAEKVCRCCAFAFTPTSNYQFDCATCQDLIPSRLRFFAGRRALSTVGPRRFLARPCRCCGEYFDPIGSKTRDCPTCKGNIPKRLREASTRRPKLRRVFVAPSGDAT